MMKNSCLILYYIIIFSLFSPACNNKKIDIDLSLIKKEIKWGMNYKTVKKILNENYDLTFMKKDQIFNNSTYLFSGGNFIGIKSKGWKFKFINGAIEGIDIWIENKTKEEMLWNYQRLTRYFNQIAEFAPSSFYDTWVYYSISNDGNKNCDTDIFLDKKENKILINIIRNSINSETIFIYN